MGTAPCGELRPRKCGGSFRLAAAPPAHRAPTRRRPMPLTRHAIVSTLPLDVIGGGETFTLEAVGREHALTIIGPPGGDAAYETFLAERIATAGNVRNTGFVDTATRTALVAEADVLLANSSHVTYTGDTLDQAELFGLVILEAVAVGPQTLSGQGGFGGIVPANCLALDNAIRAEKPDALRCFSPLGLGPVGILEVAAVCRDQDACERWVDAACTHVRECGDLDRDILPKCIAFIEQVRSEAATAPAVRGDMGSLLASWQMNRNLSRLIALPHGGGMDEHRAADCGTWFPRRIGYNSGRSPAGSAARSAGRDRLSPRRVFGGGYLWKRPASDTIPATLREQR